MLADKTSSPWSLKEFERFLRSNHCLESLEFYLEVKNYAREASAYDNSDKTTTCPTLHKLWKKIIHTYISIDAPKELNITDDHKRKLTGLAACEASPPSEPNVIKQVLDFAIETIRDGVYLQFVNEQSFYNILCARKNASSESQHTETSVGNSGMDTCSCYITGNTESRDLTCSPNGPSTQARGGNSTDSLVSFQAVDRKSGNGGNDSGHSSTAQLSPSSQEFSEDGDLVAQTVDIVEDTGSPEASGQISSSSYKRISILQRHEQIRGDDPCISCSVGDKTKSNHWKKVSARLRKLVG